MTEFLWKEALDWLIALRVLPPTHVLRTSPRSSITDFAYGLRDGVLLCHLSESLCSGSIETKALNARPGNAAFLCLKNIRLFLNAAKDTFGLEDRDLFTPSNLYDFSDFSRVLHTLSVLSKTNQVVLSSGIPGFPSVENSSVSLDEEKIYRTLEDVVTEDQYKEFTFKHQGSNGLSSEEKDEGIYQDLCSLKSIKNYNDFFKIIPLEKKDHALKELLETERNYVEVLNMLRKNFLKTLTSLKDTDKKIIFNNIIELGDSHVSFLQSLTDVLTRTLSLNSTSSSSTSTCHTSNSTNVSKKPKRIGDVFSEHKLRFLKYADYISGLSKAVKTLDALESKNSIFRSELFLAEKSANGGKFKLRDLLAVPLQRILKYHLLLGALLEASSTSTSTSASEISSIQSAYDIMVDVADYINEVKRDSEQILLLSEIQGSLIGAPEGLFLPSLGRLRKDGELRISSHESSSKASKLRFVFLFDKFLLVSKALKSGGSYAFKSGLSLYDYTLQEDSRSYLNKRSSSFSSSSSVFSFHIVHTQNTNAFTVNCKNEDEKRSWMSKLFSTLSDLSPPSESHCLRYISLPTPSSCAFCSRLLKGLFHQGYNCTKCSRVFHGSCISSASPCGFPSAPNYGPFETSSSPSSYPGKTRTTLTTSSSKNLPLHHPRPNPEFLDHFPWYDGSLTRDSSNSRLLHFPPFSFCIRPRVQGSGYALSLKTTTGDVKHMKILTSISSSSSSITYSLSESRSFASLKDLVSWYGAHSLNESFSGLDAHLRFPIKELRLVKALFDYFPELSATETGDGGIGGEGEGEHNKDSSPSPSTDSRSHKLRLLKSGDGDGGGEEEINKASSTSTNKLRLVKGKIYVVFNQTSGEDQGSKESNAEEDDDKFKVNSYNQRDVLPWLTAYDGLHTGYIPKDYVLDITETEEGVEKNKYN